MKYLPFEEVVIKTTLNREELVRELSKNIGEPLQFFKFVSSHNKPFNGTVSESGFHIWRVINYRNSFLPQIIGDIAAINPGCSISITFRLSWFVLVFICIWMGFVSLACLGILFYILKSGDLSGFQFIPFGMFLFGALLTLLPFKYEVKRAKNLLIHITDGEIVE